MRLNLKALVISTAAPAVLVLGILSVWSRISVTFGTYFMQAYNSIHPHPFTALHPALTWYEHIYGTLFDMLYAGIDVAFLAGIVGFLYNWIAKRSEGE
ncbi:MAG: hypothetical protein KDK23_14590 [Leptospiraceae bacterium]|nr:hypothetical protein [Leptospiraceae bacterium]